MRLLALGYRFVWLAMVVALAAIGVPCAAIANEPLPPQTGAAAPQTPGAAPAAVQDTPWQPNSIVYDSPYLGWGHFNPQIAVDSAGNAYAAWEDCRLVGHGCDIYFAYRPASAGWQANERIDDDTTAAHQSRARRPSRSTRPATPTQPGKTTGTATPTSASPTGQPAAVGAPVPK